MKTLTKWLCCLSAFFILGCSSSQRSLSIDELPALPADKARLIVIYDRSPILWRATPFSLAIDRKSVLWMKTIPKFSVIDVEPGKRELTNFTKDPESNERFDSHWYRKPLELVFQPGETRYFFFYAIEVNDHGGWRSRFYPTDVWSRPYRYTMREIGPIEAAQRLRVTRVSG